jgi:alpha-galactosidase
LPALGYRYFNLDNGWQKNYKKGNSGSLTPGASSRDPKTKRLLADPDKFPNGMKAWCDEVHNAFQGAKCGIYTMTCLSEGHWDIDARTFADWGVGAYNRQQQFSIFEQFKLHLAYMNLS